MELGISPVKLPPSAADNARARPRDDNARAKPRDDNARARPRDDNARAKPRDDNARDERLVPGATQRIGTNFDSSSSNERQPARSTDPFGRAGRGGSARPAAAGPPALPPKPAATGPSWQGAIGGPAPSQRAAGPAWAARSLAPAPASKRASRVGDKTIVTRRGSSTRDWLFIGLIVAALGVTASMLLSYRNENNASEAAAADATNVEHSVNAAADSPAKQNAATAPSNVTEIVSNPPNAEVVFGGAVIGNTPVRVARTNFDADYLVRLGGYDPQLVRVSSSSPSTIVVALKALAH
jgi:hypothetical protein